VVVITRYATGILVRETKGRGEDQVKKPKTYPTTNRRDSPKVSIKRMEQTSLWRRNGLGGCILERGFSNQKGVTMKEKSILDNVKGTNHPR